MRNLLKNKRLFALGGSITALLTIAACGDHGASNDASPLVEPTAAARSALSSDDGACTILTSKPELWFPLSPVDAAGNTREVIHAFDSQVVSVEGPQFKDGPVGPYLDFDGYTFVNVSSADRIESSPDGFTFGAWVSPTGTGTIAAHATLGAPGSYRIYAADDASLAFEVCDSTGCASHQLPGAVPSDRWSFVTAAAKVVENGEGRAVEVTLTSHAEGADPLTSVGSIAVEKVFGFGVPGPLSVGAALVAAPVADSFDAPDVVYSPIDGFHGGIDEVMLWSGPLGDSVISDLTGSGPISACEDCIRDVTPPTITCPASIGVEVGTAIKPAEAAATDNCDASPQIFMAMSSPVLNKSGDVTTITYTAIDAAGNEASCTSEVEAYEPPPSDPVNKAGIIGGTCVVTAAPGVITTGGTLTITSADLSYQGTNGWVEVSQKIYITDPSAQGGALERYVGGNTHWTLGARSGFGGSWNTVVINNERFVDQIATITNRVEARDDDTNELIKTWTCSTTVTIRPVVTEYCGQPIAYWANAFQTGQVNLLLMPPQTWNDASSWFDGTEQADFILGNQYNNKIRGNGGNDCIVGLGGDDKIHGNQGSDRLDGGPGNDEIWGDNGNDTIWGGADPDTLHGNDEPDWIYGGSYGDWIEGDGGNDMIWGESGDDILIGNSGVDTIEGGAGDDQIAGDTGNDVLRGGLGCDQIQGGDNDDTIEGGDFGDRAWGGGGRDTIRGGTGKDYLRGDGDDDTINGNEDDDMICGNDGSDTIRGDANTDECRGGLGSDSIVCEDSSGRECNWNNWGVNGLLYPCQ